MNYLEYKFNFQDTEINVEILIALLYQEGYEGFIESENQLLAYLKEIEKDEQKLNDILHKVSGVKGKIKYSCALVPEKNWNEQWESSFRPIHIDKKVMVRASFHDPDPLIKYDIVIDPKMSFGTGHHETTRLMIRAMLKSEFANRLVLDMGSGTGVLSILASKFGAQSVTAVDIDEWAYKNCIENSTNNSCTNIQCKLGSLDQVYGMSFDLILANINRNVLLADLKNYFKLLATPGHLILSGIMVHDLNIILTEALNCSFTQGEVLQEGTWISIILHKKMLS